jgi:hypothetical protein
VSHLRPFQTSDPPITDDGNHWLTGKCYLYCRRENVRVIWIGRAKTPRGDGSIFGCESCVHELTYMIEQQLRTKDLGDLIAR